MDDIIEMIIAETLYCFDQNSKLRSKADKAIASHSLLRWLLVAVFVLSVLMVVLGLIYNIKNLTVIGIFCTALFLFELILYAIRNHRHGRYE